LDREIKGVACVCGRRISKVRREQGVLDGKSPMEFPIQMFYSEDCVNTPGALAMKKT
jgi:hypothetical protein